MEKSVHQANLQACPISACIRKKTQDYPTAGRIVTGKIPDAQLNL